MIQRAVHAALQHLGFIWSVDLELDLLASECVSGLFLHRLLQEIIVAQPQTLSARSRHHILIVMLKAPRQAAKGNTNSKAGKVPKIGIRGALA